MTTESGGFARLYGEGYRGLLLTAHALLDDAAAAEDVTRDAFAAAYRRRARLADEENLSDWVRAEVVRLARRRLRWRPPRRGRAVELGSDTVLRLHRLAGLPAADIASIVDMPVAAVESALADAEPVCWASVRQPVVSRVIVRSAQQVTRRRMLAGAAAAAVVVGLVVPMLRVEDAVPKAAHAPTKVAEPAPPYVPPGRFIFGVGFADVSHGFALRGHCEGNRCTAELLSTEDGIRWTARPVPNGGVPLETPGRLTVLGPEEVVVDRTRTTNLSGVDRRLHSTDAGRTWTEVSAVPRRTVREIPPGATLVSDCAYSDPTDCSVSVVLPGSGQSARLAGAPRLLRMHSGDVPLAGNRWWMAGLDPRTRHWAVALSTDGGRTWTVSDLPAPDRPTDESWSVVANGDDVYASLIGPLADHQFGVVAIFYSADGGRTWERTSGPVRHANSGSPVAATDGTLLVNTEFYGTLVSRDHGRSFAEAQQRFKGVAYWSRAGYVAARGPADPIMFSVDGVHWRDLKLRA